MSEWIYTSHGFISMPGTSKSFPGGFNTIHQQRLPSDPFYLADVTIQNAVIGSSYILLGPDGTTVLSAAGTISTDPQTLSNIEAFADPYVIELRLRKSSPGVERYKPLNQFAVHNSAGITIYVSQIESSVL